MTDDTVAERPGGTPTRRRVLAGAAAVGAVGTLGAVAGCASDSDSGDSDTGAPTSGQETRRTGTLTKTSEVPVGGGRVVVVENAKVVVTQPVAGEFHAFSAICTHAGCTVQGVADGQIACPCHGSRFDATTGEVVVGHDNSDPSQQSPLAVVEIAVQGDTISFA
jgi:nitrite reductase/ring-hydroxylating ferredoxin subunit